MASEGGAGLLPIPCSSREHNTVAHFKLRVCRLWQSALVRRSQRAEMRWERLTPVLNRWIPPPRVLHPYPDVRVYATLLRKSRMRRRARTDLCGGRSAMVVPAATVIRFDEKDRLRGELAPIGDFNWADMATIRQLALRSFVDE